MQKQYKNVSIKGNREHLHNKKLASLSSWFKFEITQNIEWQQHNEPERILRILIIIKQTRYIKGCLSKNHTEVCIKSKENKFTDTLAQYNVSSETKDNSIQINLSVYPEIMN